MARFNIEDELRADPRFDKLCREVGKQMAYGAICCLWETGQAYWKTCRPIPKHIAEHLPNITELVRHGFVQVQTGGYYCSGAKERWKFLSAKSEAGKKSAEVRRNKYGSAQPRPEQTPNTPNKLEPSGSGSSSGSGSKERDPAPARDGAVQITKPEHLFDITPLITREKWAHRYPDKDWLRDQYTQCFEFHSADPATRPRTIGQWVKKMHTWLEIGWAKRGGPPAGAPKPAYKPGTFEDEGGAA